MLNKFLEKYAFKSPIEKTLGCFLLFMIGLFSIMLAYLLLSIFIFIVTESLFLGLSVITFVLFWFVLYYYFKIDAEGSK
jgi:hypothetical protein